MEKYISNYTGEQIDTLLSQIQSNVSQADLDALKAELVLRLQGTSTNQDGYKDPVFYKEFVGSATLDDMNMWLNNQFFAIKDGVYYRNGQSGSYAISKDVPQCLINLSYQGIKIYVFNSPRSYATGTFAQFAIGAAVSGNGITWGSHIMRRQSTYDFTTKKATWTAWEKINSDVDKTYVDTQLAKKVDKVSGKSLSTNDYTTTEKTKLAGIETGANKTIVDTALSTTSTNPVQNKAVATKLNEVNLALENEITQVYETTSNLSSRLTDVENIAGINATYTSTATASNMFIQNAADFLEEDEYSTTISSTPDPYAMLPVSNDVIHLAKGSVITTQSVCFLVRDKGSNIVSTLVRNNVIKYEATEDMTVRLVAYDYYFPISYTVMNAIDNIKDNIKSINNSISYINSSKASTTYVDNKVSPKADKTYVDEEIRKKVSYEELERYPNQIYNRFTNFDSKEVSPMSFYTWNNGDGGYGGSHPILKTCIEHYNEEMFAFDESNSTFLWFDWDNTKKKWIYQGQTCRDFSDSDIEEENRKHIDLETPSLAYLLSTPYLAMHLRELYLHISTIIKNDEDTHSYGIQFDTSVSSPTCTRIGSPTLHKTLPIQSKMRGCLLLDNGTVSKYLNASNWTTETRDGKYGQVMVEIPEHYRKCTQEGTICTVRLSELPIEGYKKIPKMYVSAYEASIQRSTGKLCSVVNTTTDYRGGNNTSAYDGTYRSLLGMPVTSLSRTAFRDAARKRNNGDTRWNLYMYHAHKAIFWLFATEYATLNSQAEYNAELTSEGYRQGGLGSGVTNFALDWGAHNGYNPIIPCGCTDALGNSTGEVTYNVMKSDGTVGYAAKVARYRGIENPFGHIWKWTDGINIEANPTTANGGNNLSKVYVREYGSGLSDTGYSGYTHVGNEARTDGYVKQIIFGNGGEIIPSVVGGSTTTYFCDYHWTSIPSTTTLRGVLFGGNAADGAAGGLAYAGSSNAPSDSNASVGSRLCFLA